MEALDVLVLGASRYDFEDRQTRQQLKGCTVHYVPLQLDNTKTDVVGYKPAKATLDFDKFGLFSGKEFPIRAKATLTVDLAANKIKVTNFTFMGAVKL